jgi:membrane protein YqaA with SNARE-associated domain
MSTVSALLLTWAIVLVINLVPAFMPPSWAVMAAMVMTTRVPLLILTIGGAAVSAVGRTGLALMSRRVGHFLPDSDRRNAQALADFVNRHRNWREAIVFLYSLGPFPSNPLFIAAGIGRIPLLRVTIAFFISRAIADTFWVWTAGRISGGLGGLFLHQVTSWKAIAIQLAALAMIVLVFRLPWGKRLGVEEHGQNKSDAASPAAERLAGS